MDAIRVDKIGARIPRGLVVCDVNPYGVDLGFGNAMAGGQSIDIAAFPVLSGDAASKVLAFEATGKLGMLPSPPFTTTTSAALDAPYGMQPSVFQRAIGARLKLLTQRMAKRTTSLL